MSKKFSEKSPRNWPKASRTIQRVARFGWNNGTPCDKHDLRRENVAALYW